MNSLAPSGKLVQVHPVRLTAEPGDIFTAKSSTAIDANRLATVLLLAGARIPEADVNGFKLTANVAFTYEQ